MEDPHSNLLFARALSCNLLSKLTAPSPPDVQLNKTTRKEKFMRSKGMWLKGSETQYWETGKGKDGGRRRKKNKKAQLTQRSARDRRRLVNHNTIPGAECSQNYMKIRTYSSSRPSKVDDFGTNRKRICEFLLVINSNFGPILHHFWDTASYWLKIAYFSYPSLIRRLRSQSSLWNCRVKLSVRKLESWATLWWRLRDPNFNRLWLIHPCDGRTDGQTDRRAGDGI